MDPLCTTTSGPVPLTGTAQPSLSGRPVATLVSSLALALSLAVVPACSDDPAEPEAGTAASHEKADGGAAGNLASAVVMIDGVAQVPIPKGVRESKWMKAYGKAQIAAAADIGVFHDFSFTDRSAESGITFRNRIVDDAGRSYQAVHYDHGNGVVVADVDGDDLLDIYFTTQVGGNELWRNLGGGRFEDITEQAGVAVADRIGVTAAFADIDNDGDADLYVTSVRDGNLLFENDGHGRFKDITETANVGYHGHSSSADFFDYDNDGLLDLFVSNIGQYTTEKVREVTNGEVAAQGDPTVYKFYDSETDAFSGHIKPGRDETSLLYHNLGGNRFEDVTEAMGLSNLAWNGDTTPLDLDQDGFTDLYLLNMQGHDLYFRNEGGKAFVQRGREVFPKTSWGAMSLQSFDYDNDGDMDLFVTDMHSDMSAKVSPREHTLKSDMQWPESLLRSGGKSIYGNTFFQNQGDGSFKEISDSIGAENYWPWGLSVGDLNADGWQDAFLTSSMNYPFRYQVNSLLLNDGGMRFRDAEFVLGVEPRKGGVTAAPWFELDCSGADSNHRDCKGQTGKIVVWSSLGSRSSVLMDVDGDGDLDIVTNESNTPPLVLVSNLSEQQPDLSWVEVALQGTTSNRDALGARVTVRAGGKSYTQVLDGQSGYLSQSRAPLYFGLDGAKSVESLEVLWPSGKRQVVKGPIDTNRRHSIVEE